MRLYEVRAAARCPLPGAAVFTLVIHVFSPDVIRRRRYTCQCRRPAAAETAGNGGRLLEARTTADYLSNLLLPGGGGLNCSIT